MRVKIRNKTKEIRKFGPFTNYEMKERVSDMGGKMGQWNVYTPKYERG
jgi:hypothetical protein